MSYSVNTLQTVADCDAMLNMANKDKAALLAKQTILEQTKTRYQENSLEVEAEIPSVLAELTYLNGIIPTLPEGATKLKREDEKRRQESKLYLLNNKKESYGIMAVLDKEFELARVALEITEADAYITAITNRKAEL